MLVLLSNVFWLCLISSGSFTSALWLHIPLFPLYFFILSDNLGRNSLVWKTIKDFQVKIGLLMSKPFFKIWNLVNSISGSTSANITITVLLTFLIVFFLTLLSLWRIFLTCFFIVIGFLEFKPIEDCYNQCFEFQVKTFQELSKNTSFSL